MSYVDLAWPWGLVTLGLQPLLSPAQDQVKPTRTPTYTLWSDGTLGDQHCQQIVFFGYFNFMTSFHHNSRNVDISGQLTNENQGWLDRRTLVAAAYTFAGFRSQCSSDCRWSRQPNTSWGHSRITFMQALTEWALGQSSCLWKVTSTKRCLATSISDSGTDYPSTIHLCISFPPNIHTRT